MNWRRIALLAAAIAAVLAGDPITARADEPDSPPDTAAIATPLPSPDSAFRTIPEEATPPPPGFVRRSDAVERAWPKPTPTLLKSMVFPGWGQYTNHRYAKAAIVFGLESWYIGNLVHHWRKSNQYLADFRADPSNLAAFQNYDFHRGSRNDYMWYLGITVFVSMFDAYVDAHLRPYEQDRIPDVAPPPGIAFVIKSF